ncbi:MAG: DNA mismatch repair protein MutS [Chloroflexi bacterium]|nr:DNA mismatch repair protein MutS [Chloroflexota bacterium]
MPRSQKNIAQGESREQDDASGSPVRRQYERIKAQSPNGILLFRMGDFYETFGDDAEVAARELGIVLTSREMGKGHRLALAGFPAAALDTHLAQLIAAGHRVAVCEQVGDPRTTKGLLERDIVRVVTQGTVIEPGLLPGAANNFLAAAVVEGDQAGFAYIDITTSEFVTTQIPVTELSAMVARMAPAELLVPAGETTGLTSLFAGTQAAMTPVDLQWFDAVLARQQLLDHFGAADLTAFGCEDLPLAAAAAGAITAYVRETQRGAVPHVRTLVTTRTNAAMGLDAQTVRTLELFQQLGGDGRGHTLLHVLDATKTPMGARMLRRWIGEPSLNLTEIGTRQEAVASLLNSSGGRARMRGTLGHIGDLERLVNRARSGVAMPRDLATLLRSLDALGELRTQLETAMRGDNPPLAWATRAISRHEATRELIRTTIADDPSASLGDGAVIRPGFSEDLDRLRGIARDGKAAILALEGVERIRTGIATLKVGYSRVFGYYIEVTRPHLSKIPADYVRKQTVASGERFFTTALKDEEERITDAQERAEELEAAVFRQICRQVGEDGDAVLASAQAVARLDVLAGLAEVAVRGHYVRPTMDDGRSLMIVDGRHPVVEGTVESPFVPNDLMIDDGHLLVLITGPNMSGKSTFLRQVALITLMAQVGSYVPAKEAHIGLVDRIFTRAGLHDDISTGRSTFMVEMSEVGHILEQATDRSLIVLDEIGRGTSTYDGLAIAWAVLEHIHDDPRLGARTLFATHYHELVALGDSLPRAINLHAAVADEDGHVVFLRRIMPGGSDRSYGVHVAELAGLPRTIIARAHDVLAGLEATSGTGPRANGTKPQYGQGRPVVPSATEWEGQPALFSISVERDLARGHSPVEEAVRSIAPDEMTPREALAKLYELRRLADEPDSVDDRG